MRRRVPGCDQPWDLKHTPSEYSTVIPFHQLSALPSDDILFVLRDEHADPERELRREGLVTNGYVDTL